MGYAYDESPFAPLRTTTSGTSLPDKDSEIARLRAELAAVAKERDASRLVSEGLHASNVNLRAELAAAKAERDSARAALDKEREATDYANRVIEWLSSDHDNGERDTVVFAWRGHYARHRSAEAKEPPHA